MFGLGRYSSAQFASMTSVQAKILVVENDIKTGDHYRLGLSEAGFAVDLAKSGIEALKLASLQMFDLLIIDTALKGMTGCELLQALRRQDSLIPVLFLNGRDHHECRVNTLQRGVEDFLKKAVLLLGTPVQRQDHPAWTHGRRQQPPFDLHR